MEQGGHLLPFPQAPDGVELRHLRAFVAVAEELSFARAAERLYVSQPALSRQIRGLEQLLGVELLRRSTHRVELTLAGEALLGRARGLLREVDEAVAATLAVGGELIGRISRLWEPMVGLLGSEGDLRAARAAIEDLNAQIPTPDGVRVRPVTAGGVPALVVAPADQPPATVLYLHGGGYVLGSAFGYQPHAAALALASQTGVLVADYRLAPEHPYPAAVEDALRAYRWLIERQAPETVILAGDSCGAGLVMSLLLTLRRDGLPLPRAGVLLCPWLDLELASAPATSEIPGAGLDEAQRCVEMYLAGHDPNDPLVAPLKADLHGLPPLLVQAATGDARLVDAKALVARARDHGVDATLDLYPVDAHAFHLFWSFLPEAADALAAAGAFMAETSPRRHARDA